MVNTKLTCSASAAASAISTAVPSMVSTHGSDVPLAMFGGGLGLETKKNVSNNFLKRCHPNGYRLVAFFTNSSQNSRPGIGLQRLVVVELIVDLVG